MADLDARPADDRGPFERVYDEHVVAIYRFIYARIGNRPDAEDLTAGVFMRAVEQLDTTRSRGQIAGWLYRVSQNAIADYWRAFYRLPLVGVDQVAPGWEPVEPNPPPEPADRPGALVDGDGGEGVAGRRVRQLLARLPVHYARVLELRFLERMSVAETADEMGISRGNAKILQYRALRKAALLGDGDE